MLTQRTLSGTPQRARKVSQQQQQSSGASVSNSGTAASGSASKRDGTMDTEAGPSTRGKGRAPGASSSAATTSARAVHENSTTPGRRSLYTMECTTCEQSQRRFVCASCVATYIKNFREILSRQEAEKQRLQEGVRGLLEQLEPRRRERATKAVLVDRTREVKREVDRLRSRSLELREKVRKRKAELLRRRQALQRALQLVSSPLTLSPLTTAQARLDTLSDRLALARRGLALLLMEVFDLRQQPQPGGSSTAAQATIVGLPFPRPGDHRHTKPEQINGVLSHTLHFLHLLAYYLGIKLPFVVTWSGGRFLVGKPTIRASQGTAEDGDWVRWTVKQPLYVSQADVVRYSGTGAVPSSFTTALSMLGYNVLYLLYTQSLPLSAHSNEPQLPPKVLNELIRLCISDTLGRKSHATRPHLPPPTHGFELEFGRVLEAAKEADGSLRAEEVRRAEEGDEGWDLVEDSG